MSLLYISALALTGRLHRAGPSYCVTLGSPSSIVNTNMTFMDFQTESASLRLVQRCQERIITVVELEGDTVNCKLD